MRRCIDYFHDTTLTKPLLIERFKDLIYDATFAGAFTGCNTS